jgi:uncharacterized protein (DUF983 family)
MQRICPNCSVRAIPVAELLFGVCHCPNCRLDVRVNRLASILFSLVIVVVTVATSLMVLSLFGVYAVILWFAFPIGAIGYLKARYCPLTVLQR